MSRLYELIAKLCLDGVEYAPLGDVLKSNNASNSISKKDYKDVGNIPIIDQSHTYIAAYTDDESAVPPILPCIIFGDHTRVVKYADRKFAQGDSGTKVFVPITDNLDTKYIYYAFCSLDIPSRGYNRHWTIAKNIKIPLPPLPVQQEIVRILDKYTELSTKFISNLSAELTARKKQYEFYRDLLLSFGEEVPRVKLKDIATDMYRGSGIKRDEITEDGTPCVRYGEIYTTYNIWFDSCVSHTRKGTKTFEHGDILFAITGESVEEIAKSCAYMGHEKCFAGGDVVVMKHNQNPKYLAYALSTYDAQTQKSEGKVKNKVVHSSIPALKEIQIPLPPLDEQARIVSILDKFYELTINITNLLPAEIEARQKQYEYYRDKLLSFKEVSA